MSESSRRIAALPKPTFEERSPRSAECVGEAQQFLARMREVHGIQEDFLQSCRPMVETIFADFTGDTRSQLLEIAELVVAQQAAVEKAANKVYAALDASRRRAEADARAKELASAHEKLSAALRVPSWRAPALALPN
jgi:hypothetical protein